MSHSNSGDSLKSAPPIPPPSSSPAPIAPPTSSTKLKSEKIGKKGDSPRNNPAANQSAKVVLVQVPAGATPGTTVRIPGPDGNSVFLLSGYSFHSP